MLLLLIPFLLYIQHTLTWAVHVHEIILELALSGLDDYIKNDLQYRVALFKEAGLSQDVKSLAGLADQMRDIHGFNFMNKFHRGGIFEYNNGITVYQNQPLSKAVSKFYSYLVRSNFDNLVFDTFSLVYLLHTTGELFQPLHTTTDSGHKTTYSQYSLHSFWDYTCNFSGLSSKNTVKTLQEIENSKVIKFNKETIKAHLNDNFKKEFDINKTIQSLKTIYENKYINKSILETILDPSILSMEEYKKFCISVTVPNLIHSAWTMRAMLKNIYKNKKSVLKEPIKVAGVNSNNNTSGIDARDVVLVIFLFIFIESIIVAVLVYKKVIFVGRGGRKRNRAAESVK